MDTVRGGNAMTLKIEIVETGNGLVAQVFITDPEFDDDLARVKRIPYEDINGSRKVGNG